MTITVKHLETLVARLNEVAGTPETPYTKNTNGTFTPNAFCYHLSGAYGGHMVVQMCEGSTGVTTPITSGHVTKRECYETLYAFIRGFERGLNNAHTN